MKRLWPSLVLCGGLALGALTLRPALAQTNLPPRPRGALGVNFNFDQVEIRTLARLVGELTGKRFLVDNTVTGRVTVVTPTQIPQGTVYPLFLNVLEATGYSVVEHDQMFHVVALPERALPAAPLAASGVTAQGVVTKVISLKNVNALELRKILEPMVRGGKSGALAALEQSNHLVITDTRENITRLERIIVELDQPGATRAIEVLHLEHAAAEEVAAQINAALRGGDTTGNRVARQVQQLAGAGGGLPTDVVIVAAAQANTLLLAGRPAQLADIKALIKKMDVATSANAGRLNAIFLKYLPAAEAAKGLTALLAKTVDKDQRQRISIESSIANNALMVEASPADFELVKALVTKLDLVPQQVMVEVLIAEVSMNRGLNLGVEWNQSAFPAEGQTKAVGRFYGSSSDPLASALAGNFPQGLALGIAHGTFSSGSNIFPNVIAMITALASSNDVKILSNVPLWAQNNTEATVKVIDNIPVLKSTVEGGAGTARDVIQNIDRMDVGIELKITPQVNPDRQVMMKLNPSIGSVTDEGPSGQFAPTISKRDVTTTVTVPDETTIVISGLIRQDRLKTENKIPWLGDIPLIGFLFRSTGEKVQRTNLLIFVTPHIVTDMRKAQAMQRALEGKTGINAATNSILAPRR
jgi:general secretion pathway protein D